MPGDIKRRFDRVGYSSSVCLMLTCTDACLVHFGGSSRSSNSTNSQVSDRKQIIWFHMKGRPRILLNLLSRRGLAGRPSVRGQALHLRLQREEVADLVVFHQ